MGEATRKGRRPSLRAAHEPDVIAVLREAVAMWDAATPFVASQEGLPSGVPQTTLFHVMRNEALRETALLRGLSDALRAALPSTWSLTSRNDVATDRARIDAVLTLAAPDGVTATVFVEAKRVIEPRDVPSVLRQLESYRRNGDAGLLVTSSYLSPRVRYLLQEAGAGWFDATGNLRLQLERPSVFIDRTGATRSPFTDAEDRRLKSLKGPGAARVVRALLDGQPPIGVRALAELAEVAAATSARVLELLAREDVIEREADGRVEGVRKLSLARRWTSDYGLTTTNQAVPTLAARGIDRVLAGLRRYEGEYAITAEAATRAYLPPGRSAVAPLSLLTIFVANATVAGESLKMRPADRGANVLLVEPFDPVVFRGAIRRDRLRYAAPSQVIVDLLTAPGRAAEEAQPLVETLAAADPGWAR